MDILEMIKSIGLEIPEDKKEEFNKNFREQYKSVKELEKVKTKLTNAEEQLKTANGKIQEFESLGDVGEIQKQAKEYKEKYENAEKEFNNQLTAINYKNAVEKKLGNYEFTSNYAKEAITNKIIEAGLKIEDDKIIGFDDYMSKIKENDPNAFKTKENKPQFSTKQNQYSTNKSDSDNTLRSKFGLPPL